jgi:chromosome segregation ATPase
MDTQDEDYKVLQAMRTEINGLVESQNRLNLEIQELQRQKAQAELETSAVQTKLNDVSGEWQKKMDALVAKQAEVTNAQIALATERQQYENEKKERETALDYALASAKKREIIIQQQEAEIASRDKYLKEKEAKLGQIKTDLDVRGDKYQKDLLGLIKLQGDIDHVKHENEAAKAELEAEKARIKKEDERLRTFEGQISLASSNQRAELVKREEYLRQREEMIRQRELEMDKQKAVMDTRITKREAVDVERMKNEVVDKTNQLYKERSEFEVAKQNAKNELFVINENIVLARHTLNSLEEKINDVTRREKGVADSEAGLAAKEKQLMFEIAKFKKRVSDAKMEEAINESR